VYGLPPHRVIGSVVAGQRERGQAQSGRPALGAFLEPGEAVAGQCDSGGGQQLSRFVEGEAQVGAPYLPQLACQAEPVQPEAGVIWAGLGRPVSFSSPQPALQMKRPSSPRVGALPLWRRFSHPRRKCARASSLCLLTCGDFGERRSSTPSRFSWR
jgi:hypothetical protein